MDFDSSPQLIFSPQEAEVIVSSLHMSRDGPTLWKFFCESHYLLDPNYSTETIRFGYIFALFSTKQYPLMFKIIKESTFFKRDFKHLVEYWNEGQYQLYMEKHKKPSLSPTVKFRIRQKNPIPENIFDGSLKWGMRPSAKEELLKVYEVQNSYVGHAKTKELAEKTGLTVKQINDWFKNRRNRDKRKRNAEFLRQFNNSYGSIPQLAENNYPSPPVHQYY